MLDFTEISASQRPPQHVHILVWLEFHVPLPLLLCRLGLRPLMAWVVPPSPEAPVAYWGLNTNALRMPRYALIYRVNSMYCTVACVSSELHSKEVPPFSPYEHVHAKQAMALLQHVSYC